MAHMIFGWGVRCYWLCRIAAVWPSDQWASRGKRPTRA